MLKDTFYYDYPLIFSAGEPEQGFSCGLGWFQILDALFECITKDLKKNPQPLFKIICIKEKFGTLRVYCDNASEYIQQTIVQAENMSANVCETCGEYGQLRDSAHWKKVRCNDCERQHFATRQTPKGYI